MRSFVARFDSALSADELNSDRSPSTSRPAFGERRRARQNIEGPHAFRMVGEHAHQRVKSQRANRVTGSNIGRTLRNAWRSCTCAPRSSSPVTTAAPLTLGAVAAALACSPRQLQRTFDQIGLTSFGAHLRSVRMRNAGELLATQSLTVADVSRLVGYQSAAHFVTAFRARYGTTPGACRDRARARRERGREGAPGQSVASGVQT